MEINQEILDSIQSELKVAEKARQEGNDGKARVCARRAAGFALGEYFKHQGFLDPGPSAVDRLNLLMDVPSVSIDNRQRAYRLTVRVTRDHELPFEADLIDDARVLIHELLDIEV